MLANAGLSDTGAVIGGVEFLSPEVFRWPAPFQSFGILSLPPETRGLSRVGRMAKLGPRADCPLSV